MFLFRLTAACIAIFGIYAAAHAPSPGEFRVGMAMAIVGAIIVVGTGIYMDMKS